MILPTTPTAASTGGPRCLILYGKPKVGKTTVCLSLPDYLLIDLERGSDYATALKVQLKNCQEIDALAKAINDAKMPYKFLIIDALGALETMSEIEATRRYKASVIGKTFAGDSVLDLPKGLGFFYWRITFFKYFEMFRTLAPYVIFIGHVRDSLITSEGKEVTVRGLDLTGKTADMACSAANGIGHVMRDNAGTMHIGFETKNSITCGTHCSHLRNADFKMDYPATLANWKQIYPQL